MKLCFTGDSILLSAPHKKYWSDNPLLEKIHSCDVRSTNLEMDLSGGQTFASTFCGGYWITGNEKNLDELQKFNFNHYAMANNHTMDYSYKGLKISQEILDNRHLMHSGSGSDLAVASSAVCLTVEDQKVAFVSCTASCDDAARAGYASRSVPGRPGVNMLRHSETLFVTKEHLRVIDDIANQTCINARFQKSVKMGIHSLDPKIHRLGRLEFKESKDEKKVTECNKSDLRRIVNEVAKSRQTSDIVVVSVHSHDIKGMSDDTPDDYLEEFAHACIDAGASVVVGTGTHQLKAIEVYKGVPIFYSLGNFIFSSERMCYAPADYYERYNVNLNKSLLDVWNKRSKNETVGLEFDPLNYKSILPIITFESGTITNVELVPLELGFCGGVREKGFPYLADYKESKEIIQILQERSEPYKTRFGFHSNAFYIENLDNKKSEESDAHKFSYD